MKTSPLFLMVALIVVLAIVAFALQSSRSSGTYKAIKIMTDNELEFFGRLARAVSTSNGHVFPQVAMAALIAPMAMNAKQRLADFRKISQKRVDYAIYTAKMDLLCIVELDDRTHQAAKDIARDAILKSAGIQTLRWQSNRKPTEAQIHASLMQLQTTLPKT